MARKLKVYRTSIGFFELAVAVPSMKAAAEAWGSDPDIFSRGFAERTEDPKIVEAAMAAPGLVLRRPVGSDGEFKEKAALPKPPKLPKEKPPKQEPAEQRVKPDEPDTSAAKRKSDADATERKQEAAERARQEKAAAREEAERRRELERREREAERARKRREELIAKADAVLEKARAQHEKAIRSIAARRADLDEEEAGEAAKWDGAQRDHSDAVNAAKRPAT